MRIRRGLASHLGRASWPQSPLPPADLIFDKLGDSSEDKEFVLKAIERSGGWWDPLEYAAGALMALSDRQPDTERVVDLDQRHVMISCKPGA